MFRRFYRVTFIGGLVVAIMHTTIVVAANRCCQNLASHSSCAGCIKILSNPSRYVNVGTNSVSKCESTAQVSNCYESLLTCYQMTNAQLYSNSGCSNPVGTANVTVKVRQCSAGAGECGGGG